MAHGKAILGLTLCAVACGGDIGSAKTRGRDPVGVGSDGNGHAAPEDERRDAGVPGASPDCCPSPTTDVPHAQSDASVALDGASDACWSLPVVTRARLFPAPGLAAALVGGKIVGSNQSATNGFVDLAVNTRTASDGWVELDIATSEPYRYVKYYSPRDSYGAIAELELYAGDQRVAGASFGTAGARRPGSGFESALDGDTSTAFEAPLPHDNYVGYDLGAGHVSAAPQLSPAPGSFDTPQSVRLSADANAPIRYTTDGSDPREGGRTYTGPFTVGEGETIVRAVAEAPCSLASEVAQGLYRVGDSSTGGAATSMHIGNSLTDTIVEMLQPMAQSGGFTLDFNRYTVPGAGTWLYVERPAGGFGVENVQTTVRSRAFDHLSMQPYPNSPCQPAASSDGTDSDATNIAQVWSDARAHNPNVQLWVYQQWPLPADFRNCITGGAWTRPSWQPPAPSSWEDAVANELRYDEAVRDALERLAPDAPRPYIVPGGQALVALKEAMARGEVPGMGDFEGEIFVDGGRDIHLTHKGAYLITLVFYACMFQDDPQGKVSALQSGLTSEQARVFQRIAWETASAYPLSGVGR